MKVERVRLLTTIGLLIGLTSCSYIKSHPKPEQGSGPGPALSWQDVPGWQQDHHAEAWVALKKNCIKVAKRVQWQAICNQVSQIYTPDDATVRTFVEAHFVPHQLLGENNQRQGLITGYYEPLLHGSYTRTARYRYPLYAPPVEMLTVELGELYPELKGKRVRGRLVGNKVVPFYSRKEIESTSPQTSPLKDQEIIWVDSLEQSFFLQVQGSGRIELPDGEISGAGYANQNGHAYVSIGRRLIEMGELEREQVSMFTIRDWLKNNPGRAVSLMQENPSYVFFNLRQQIEEGPRGSLNVPLTARRSVAIDPKVVELGSLMWLDTTHPTNHQALQRIVVAQDTGGAIKGQVRADLFWGTGAQAEQAAGTMKQSGSLYVLLPK